jgi:hypothetical protein
MEERLVKERKDEEKKAGKQKQKLADKAAEELQRHKKDVQCSNSN